MLLENAYFYQQKWKGVKNIKKLRESTSFKVLNYFFVKETEKARKKTIPTGYIDFQQCDFRSVNQKN